MIDKSKIMVDKLSDGQLVKSDYDKEDKDKDMSDNGSNDFEIDKDDGDKIDIPVGSNPDNFVDVCGPYKSENPYLIDFPDELNQHQPVNQNVLDEMPVVLQPDAKPVQNLHLAQPQNNVNLD